MKKSIFAIPLAFGLCASVQAKSVTSDYVSVLGPEEVFAPIPDATGNVDISRLVDTPVVFDASYSSDFEVDGDLEKKVWAGVPAYTDFLAAKNKAKFPYKTEMKMRYSSKALYLGFTLYQPMDESFVQSLAFMLAEEMDNCAGGYRQTDQHPIAAIHSENDEVPPSRCLLD